MLGHVKYPGVPNGQDGTQLTVGFDYLDNLLIPVPDILVNMCEGVQDCSTPVDQGTTDVAGTVTLTSFAANAQAGLDGVLMLSGSTIYPTNVYWEFPLSQPHGRFDNPIPLLTPNNVNLIASQTQPQAGTGLIAVIVLDCLGAPAADVVVRSGVDDAGASTWYPLDAHLEGLSSIRRQTATLGVAFVANVPVGNVDLWAIPAALGASSSYVNVYVQANAVTEVSMAPTPQ